MKHIKFEAIHSTQKYLQENFDELCAQHGKEILVSTQKQTDGIGRRGNHWIDTGNALAFSFSQRPHNKTTLSSLEMGILLCEFFKKNYQIQLQMKWPNDLLLTSGEKVAGILCQVSNQVLFVGMGINFGEKISTEKLEHSRYTLGHLGNFHLDKDESHDIALAIYSYISQNRIDDEKIVIDKFKLYCSHLNKPVQIKDGETINSGIFVGIGEWGEALLENKGETHHIYNGSLSLV